MTCSAVIYARMLASEQFLNGTSAHNRPFQCHRMLAARSFCVVGLLYSDHVRAYSSNKSVFSFLRQLIS